MSLVPSEIGSGPIELTLTLDAEGPATGESPTVRVREFGSSDRYLDFNDSTFKTAGWTTRDQPMLEVDGLGTYRAVLDPSSLVNLTAGVFHVVAEYRNAGAVIPGAAHDIVSLFVSAYDLPADQTDAIWDVPAAAHQIPDTMGDLQDMAGTGANFRGGTWSVLAGATANSVPTDATLPDGFYDGMQVSIYRAGTGEVFARNVESYTGGVFTFLQAMSFIPNPGDVVEVWRQVATGGDADISLQPIYDAIDEILRKLSQVGVNIRSQIIAPTVYAGHKGDRLECVVYQGATPIDDATLSAANNPTMIIENRESGETLEVTAVAVAGGILAYTLIPDDGVMEDPAAYRVQARCEVSSATDLRWSEVRIYNVADPLEPPP